MAVERCRNSREGPSTCAAVAFVAWFGDAGGGAGFELLGWEVLLRSGIEGTGSAFSASGAHVERRKTQPVLGCAACLYTPALQFPP